MAFVLVLLTEIDVNPSSVFLSTYSEKYKYFIVLYNVMLHQPDVINHDMT